MGMEEEESGAFGDLLADDVKPYSRSCGKYRARRLCLVVISRTPKTH